MSQVWKLKWILSKQETTNQLTWKLTLMEQWRGSKTTENEGHKWLGFLGRKEIGHSIKLEWTNHNKFRAYFVGKHGRIGCFFFLCLGFSLRTTSSGDLVCYKQLSQMTLWKIASIPFPSGKQSAGDSWSKKYSTIESSLLTVGMDFFSLHLTQFLPTEKALWNCVF